MRLLKLLASILGVEDKPEFGDDKPGYNCRAIAYANSEMSKYHVGDFIFYDRDHLCFEDGYLFGKCALYRICQIEYGIVQGKNDVIKIPVFKIEHVCSEDTRDLISFYPYSSKKPGSPKPFYNAEVYPFACPEPGFKEGTVIYRSRDCLYVIKDKVKLKEYLESMKKEIESNRKAEEARKRAEELRVKQNESISSEELNDIFQEIKRMT